MIDRCCLFRDFAAQSRGQMRRNGLQQLHEDLGIARHHVAGLQVILFTREITDQSAGFLYQETTGRDIPGVQADFEEAGDEDVIRKLLGDLISAGVEVTDADIRAALDAKTVEARRALMGEA